MKMLDILRARLADLLETRAAHLSKMEAIPDAAITESRSINDAEQAEFDEARDAVKAIDKDLDEVKGRIVELEEIASRQETATRRAPVVGMLPDPTTVDVATFSNTEARGAAVSFIETSRNFASDAHRESATKMVERGGSVSAATARQALHTGSDLYGSAFMKYIAGHELELTEPERQALARGRDEQRAGEDKFAGRAQMTSGTGASGGYFVPVFIDPTMILTGAGSVNPLRQVSNVKQIGPAYGGWYGASAAQVTAVWTAEASAAPDNTPTVSQINIPVYMGEVFVGVSFQGYEDIADLASDVQMLFGDAKNNLEATAFTTGTGSSQPTGVSTAVGNVTASRVSPAVAGAIALADVFSVHNALPARFWNSTQRAWVAHIAISDKIRTLAMAQNSANSVWTDVFGGTPPQLIGDSLYPASAMSSSQTTGQDVLLFGDFSRFNIIDRVGFSVEFIPNLFDTSSGRPTASRGWLGHWRTGSNCTDPNAFRQLRL